jgi:hypothetical protein
MVAAAALCACGSPVMGTWRNTSDVTTTSGTQRVVYDLVIDGNGWQAGGGCVAPLSYNGLTARLANANWTCNLTSGSGLPYESILGYQWKSGDVMAVSDAKFELLQASDKLAIDFSLQLRTNPNDPTVGPIIELHSKAGDGADRVK